MNQAGLGATSYPPYTRKQAGVVGQLAYPPYPAGMQGAAAPVPAPLPAPSSAPTTPTFVFTPGSLPQGISAAPGSQVTFGLPPGSTWQNLSIDMLGTMPGGAIATSGSGPVPITVPPGPATVSASWIDASGNRQAGAAIFLPMGATLSTPITDSATVSAVQNLINSVVASPPSGLVLQPIAVSGNASDPGFVAQLAALQQWAVNMFANPVANTTGPSGTSIAPATLNVPTNGVLDYATLSLLSMPL